MQNFNYLIADAQTRECAYVDPAWEVDRLLKIAAEQDYQITKILLTHRHHDHVNGVPDVSQATGAQVYIHPADALGTQQWTHETVPFQDGTQIPLGALTITTLHTPGHTEGSTSYLIHSTDDPVGHLFTGDCLFQGRCGRWDFPGGNKKTMFETLQSLKTLEPSTKVYPGHDYGSRPVTTIAYEREHNATMRFTTFAEFDVAFRP